MDPAKMHEPLLIINGRIIDPENGIDATGSVSIDASGLVSAIEPGPWNHSEQNCRIINAEGMVICPGFIDFHCHLRQPGYEYKETIASGTAAAAKGGFTTVCCMPNTDPAIDSIENIRLLRSIIDKEAVVRVIPIPCVTIDRKGLQIAALEELALSGIAGFSDDGSPVYDATIMRQAIELCKSIGVPVIEHCEVPELAGDGVINEGVVSRKLGVTGIPDAAEEEMVVRDIKLARETGGWVHIAHASTAGTVELIRKAKAEGIKVTAEVTPHHLTLTEEEVLSCGSQAKVNPPLRTVDDVRALIDGLNDGTIDIIATDHAPHAFEDKPGELNNAAFGFTGFETALGSLMSLVENGSVSLPGIIDCLTRKPATILGKRFNVSGSIIKGKPADIVVFDPSAEWTVEPQRFLSKGKNTPLAGKTMRGKVIVTLCNGELVYVNNFME